MAEGAHITKKMKVDDIRPSLPTKVSENSTLGPSDALDAGTGDVVSQDMHFSNFIPLTIEKKGPCSEWTPLTPENSQGQDTIKSQEKTSDPKQTNEYQQASITLQKENITMLLRRVEQSEQQRDLLKTLCSQLLDSVSELEEIVRDQRAQKSLDDRRIADLERALRETARVGEQKKASRERK